MKGSPSGKVLGLLLLLCNVTAATTRLLVAGHLCIGAEAWINGPSGSSPPTLSTSIGATWAKAATARPTARNDTVANRLATGDGAAGATDQ